MNVLAPRTLAAFWAMYPDAEQPLRDWPRQVQRRDYAHFADVKTDFGSADWVAGYIVFDIGGNKYRLIVSPDFRLKRLFIKKVLTHRQYDAWRP